MTIYQIGNNTIRADDARLPGVLAELYVRKKRPLCTCRTPGVEMYIAKIGGQFVIKRMPNSGADHHPNCDSYDPPPELSGLGQVNGTAIQEDAEKGTTALRLDFAMTKNASRAAPVSSGEDADTVKTDGTKLTLRSMLHYLWDEAGFTKWSPSMAGKRSWYVIRKYLLQAAENKVAKGSPLTDHLYIPETFNLEKKDAITARRAALMAKVSLAHKNTRQLMLGIAEVKELDSSRYGYKIVAKHLPDWHFMLPEDLYKRIRKRFANEMTIWSGVEGSHLIVIATFSVGPTGLASIEECALMAVTENWIPFEHTFDQILIDRLSREGRRFTKCLRYNLPGSRPLASVVLTDTAPEPTAMYITLPNMPESYIQTLNELKENSKLGTWIWDVATGEMPAVPDVSA